MHQYKSEGKTMRKVLRTAATGLLLGLSAPAVVSAEMPGMKGIPGMRGTQHIGITVPDIDGAVDFLVDVVGCESFFSFGPFGPFEDDWMTANLNVDSRAVIELITVVRCGDGPAMEVFDYDAPGQSPTPPANSDIGGYHVAFYVDDIEVAAQYLREKGVEVLGEPKPLTGTALEGMQWVYFLAPWGMQMEIVSAPEGIAFDKESDRRLWDPRN